MARTFGIYSFPALLVAVGWLRLEDPHPARADWAVVAVLALLPALAPRLWLRLALSVPAALVAAWVALDTPPTDDRPGFFAPVLHRFGDGVLDYYDVSIPFSGLEQPHMHGVLVLAIFGFCLLLGQFAAARRPLPALLAVIGGAAWPAALATSGSITQGALILAAALWVLAWHRASTPVPAFVAGTAVVLVAAAASTSAALAKDGVLNWEQWDPNGTARVPVAVDYVWEAQYGGIEFSKHPTTVLRIRGPKHGLYWRATTLDQFEDDRWLENPVPQSTGPAVGALPSDPLLPTRSLNPRTWVKQEVEVVALRDTHVIGAAQPVRLDAPALGSVFQLSDGLARAYDVPPRGTRYTVWSYAPRPGPAALARVEASYPAALGRFLEIGRTRVDPFGVEGRDLLVESLFTDERYLPLWSYEALWRQAKRLRAGALTPYGAVVAIETWLRSTGGFTYDEQPPNPGGVPPLAYFVDQGKRGYCQQFAGSMALMLRFLGVPARVAAGFTSGTREDGGWTITDHNAHAWVEVWFEGYGWLPFDPTPGRGSLAATYSASSTNFNAGDAASAFDRPEGADGPGGAGELGRLLALKERLAARRSGGSGSGDRVPGSTLGLLVLLVLAVGGGIGTAKLARRRVRYLTRDPRRVAGAARRELADFLADQGVAVGASTTPAELRALVRSELGADASSFTRAIAEARFGPPELGPAAAARARRELRRLLHDVRRRLGRAARLRGLVAVRSLLG